MSIYGATPTAAIARLGWACASHGGLEASFVLDQLSHEAEVWRDVVLALFDEVECVVECVVIVLHEVSDDHGHRSRHPRVAVDKDLLSSVLGLFDEAERLG